ncbi:MAG: hypothetical protein HYT70_02735 [Candidatus Aenigmarchaeota archaeon]|nr:hypothetical protein [Candidatus Aenigmarchaeota archaeon]
MVLSELAGWGLIVLGLFFIIAFPGIQSGFGRGYMPDEFANMIILIGLILLGVGIFLVVKT